MIKKDEEGMVKIRQIPFLSQEDFEFVQKAAPMICIDIIVEDNNKILLGMRNTFPYKGLWHVPGGLLYNDEKIIDATNRITKREIGLEVKPIKMLGIYEYIDVDPRGHFIGLTYIVKKTGGEININTFNSDLQYFDHVPKDSIPCQQIIIRDALDYVSTLY